MTLTRTCTYILVFIQPEIVVREYRRGRQNGQSSETGNIAMIQVFNAFVFFYDDSENNKERCKRIKKNINLKEKYHSVAIVTN